MLRSSTPYLDNDGKKIIFLIRDSSSYHVVIHFHVIIIFFFNYSYLHHRE